MSTGTINHDTSEPNNKLILISVVGSLLVVLVTIAGAWFFYTNEKTVELNTKEVTPLSQDRQALNTYEHEALNTLKWIDKNKGEVHLPLSLAIEKIVRSYN